MSSDKFSELLQIMKRLRKECPWDREQTHESIKSATLEESYEVLDSIDNKDYSELKSELGDLLLHIVFHSVIAEENNEFNIDQVIETIINKLIRRHPHIFGDVKVTSTADITRNWESIKLSEGRTSVLDGVPKNFPELHKAFRIQEKVSKVGFDWKNKNQVWEKVLEEIAELKDAEKQNNAEEIENELGDLFFSLVNYSRFLNINPENALRRTNQKFIKRFQYIEAELKKIGKSVTDSNLEEMDKYWNESKKII
ncbi:MAG: nucleoside triphosphate pyrophosphohydrolase [Ignavibacteriales bacterium CG_4_9_14_3_um_filter_34_10]|nr:MAG: nucleoside triphosphate pyrophosphohydrolase [Ignavibacteriales bacterium CG_4_9_14_3_um_filter_34_10]